MLRAMPWVQYATLAAALVTAVATVATAAIAWRVSRYRLHVLPRVERGKDGALALYVDLVNTGGVPVRVEQVFLHPRGDDPPAIADRLCDERGHPVLPQRIEPRTKLAIGPVHVAALKAVAEFKPLTVVAKTEDGRVVQKRCRALRELYADADPGAGKVP